MRPSRDPQAPLRLVGYARVSSKVQAEEGVSLDAQESRMRAHCEAQGMACVSVIREQGSGKAIEERPGLKAALALLDASAADGLLVFKLDRLTRRVRDLDDLLTRYFAEKYALVSVSDSIDTSTAAGRLMLNVLMSVAQWEREAISERTKEGLGHLQSQGVRLGGAPLGWRHGDEIDAEGRRVLLPVQGEQDICLRITSLRSAGLSSRAIANQLIADGVPTKNGGKWHSATVAKILRRIA